MSGITSGVGIFSGIDSQSIIEQLLQIEARPRTLVQRRVASLQLQSAGFLDINARINALKAAAADFRTRSVFQTKAATTSNKDVLTATANNTAAEGTYTFLVDRLVSTQQALSRGFANKDSGAIGATGFTFESTKARLDADVELAELNNGQGVSRGRLTITDSGGQSATIDLSRATTVSEVLEAINSNGTARVTASVREGRFIITDNAGGGGQVTVANAGTSTTATSLGIAGTGTGGVITGSQVYSLHGGTTLGRLNDGNGVAIKNSVGTDVWNFSINILDGPDAGTIKVNIGDVYENQVQTDGSTRLVKTKGAATSVGQVLERINEAIANADINDMSASLDAASGRIVITDTTNSRTLQVVENGDTTARDLGLTGSAAIGSVSGARVLGGLNTTLARSLNGGAGITGNGAISFTLRNGATFNANVSTNASLSDIMKSIEDASISAGSKRVSVSLDSRGTGIVVTDLAGGSGNLVITGTTGADTAASLGISTGPAGVASSTKASGNIQRQYVGRATSLASLNGGRGVGTGVLRITDSDSRSATVDIGADSATVGDVIDEINSRGLRVTARINANGDGIEIIENTSSTPAGGAKIKIEDTSGTVAKSLNLAGEASGTGASNKINGTYEKTVAFSAADTLQQMMEKINTANVGVSAAIIRDGNGANPFRLSLTATNSGSAGRFLVDTGATDMGLATLDTGQDARVFFGSTDAARGIAITSSTNTIDNAVAGVKIDLKSANATAVTLSVARDTESIETTIRTFVQTFNTAVERIEFQTRYDNETQARGPLLGDSTALQMRSELFSMITSPATGISGRFDTLTDIGMKIGSGGTLELDEDKFRQALTEDSASVEALFSAREAADDAQIEIAPGIFARNPNAGSSFDQLGVMGKFEELAKKYTDGITGVLTGRSKGIEEQVKALNSQITNMTDRLERRRTILQRQFAAMESAIAKLQTQQSALGSIG